MSTETLLLLIVIALVVFALPAWPYSKEWGYRPLFRSSLVNDIRSAGHDAADSVRRAVR